jgi:hypothetical protein
MPLRRHLLARFSANHLPIKTKRVSPLPQHPHGAKSGLATNTKRSRSQGCTERLAGSVLMLAALADRPGFRVPCGRVGPLS